MRERKVLFQIRYDIYQFDAYDSKLLHRHRFIGIYLLQKEEKIFIAIVIFIL